MENWLTDTRDIFAIAKPLVEPLMAVLVAPKLQRLSDLFRKKGLNEKLSFSEIDKLFRDYLTNAYVRFCTMNTLVFPNQQIIIHDVYQPMTLRSNSSSSVKKMDKLDMDFLQAYGHILIADSAGMGKTTLLKWIGASIIERKSSIPILIELRRLNDKYKIIDELYTQLGSVFSDSFDRELLSALIQQGDFTFLLDGFDEVKYEFREDVVKDIKDFVFKSTKNYCILTSRPDSELPSFGNFQKFYINNLAIEEAYQLIDKLDAISERKYSSQLIIDIKEKLTQVAEFLINPFMISLLYKTYTYNIDIPAKKAAFYEEVYSALYKYHDLTKDGYKRKMQAGLDMHDFRTIVNYIAYETTKLGEVEYSERRLIKLLDDIKSKPNFVGLVFKTSAFVHDIEHSVPLFNREGTMLKWAHKSLQEFFAASHISFSLNKDKIINLMYASENSKYLNVFDFLLDINYGVIRDTIIYKIANAFVNFCDSTYGNHLVNRSDTVRRRQEIAFNRCYSFIYIADKESMSKYSEADLQKHVRFSLNRTLFAYMLSSSIDAAQIRRSIHLTANSFVYEMLNILFIRGVKIVKCISQSQGFSVKKFVCSLKPGVVYTLNDKRNNPMNAPSEFGKFTELLLDDKAHSGNKIVVLDYEECAKLVAIVKASTEASINDELNGL